MKTILLIDTPIFNRALIGALRNAGYSVVVMDPVSEKERKTIKQHLVKKKYDLILVEQVYFDRSELTELNLALHKTGAKIIEYSTSQGYSIKSDSVCDKPIRPSVVLANVKKLIG